MAYFQANMPSIKTARCIAGILAEHVLLSETIEVYRQNLSQIQHFDCIALFRYLDRQEKGYLREKDFQRIIGTKHRKLLTYAFSWFDSMKVGEVSRLQFATFLLPKDNLQLRKLLTARIECTTQSTQFPPTLLAQFEVFSKLVVEIMNRHMKIIEMRQELLDCEDYSL